MRYFKLTFNLFVFLFFQISLAQNDCSDALVVCGNSDFSGLSATGFGIQELNNSNNCFGAEYNSIWLKVPIRTSGTFGFKLIPESSDISVDYDFYVFGPNASCGNLGTAIRCSTTNPEAAGLSNNHTGMNGYNLDVSEGPGEDGNSYVKWINALAGETYYIVIDRPVGTSNFSLNWEGTATFSEPPTVTAGAIRDMAKCDSDNQLDNSTTFDLTTNGNLAIGTQTDVAVTYHTSVNDAVTNTNAIVTPTNFQNTANPQKIYIRLTNIITGCFTTSEFNLAITQYQTTNPIDLKKCDFDNDGFVTFPLRDNDAVLINGNPNVVITYHSAPNSSAPVLPDNYTNQVAFTGETIWAKIRDTSNGCYAYKSFNLIINTIPTVNAAQLTQCDFQLNPDGLTSFNLEEAIGAITGNNSNYTVAFYTQGSTTELDTVYTNIQNPQTLNVKVTDNTTQCYTYTTLTLNVTVNPTITIPLHECDADGTEDGFTTFDLTETGFANGGNTVTYYTNSSDALLEQNEIPVNFLNTTADNQRLFARIENANDCIGINIVDLFVDKLPDIEITDEDVFCLNKPDTPVTLHAGIGTQNPSLFTYLWTPGGETTSTIDVFASGTYTVKVTNAANCFKVRTILVKDSDIAIVENITVVDLTDENTITVLVQGNEDEFEYSLDSPTGPFQESNYFAGVTPGIHVIYIKDKDQCGTVPKEVTVLGVPSFFTPNGDGYNDTWRIKGMDKGYYSKSIIYIFDRFGKLLKQMSPTGEGWNGIFNNQPVAATDYWYVMHLEDGRTIKGHFALKR